MEEGLMCVTVPYHRAQIVNSVRVFLTLSVFLLRLGVPRFYRP